MSRTANSLLTLQREVDAAHPNRPKQSDGFIGDAAHAREVSDHNPNSHGVVTAWDITTAPFTDDLAAFLRDLGRNADGRVKYVIYKHRITSAEHSWLWVDYNGADPHTSHIHLSVSASPSEYDRTDSWHYYPSKDDDMTPEQASQLDRVEKLLTQLMAPRRPDHVDTDTSKITLSDVVTAVENSSGK